MRSSRAARRWAWATPQHTLILHQEHVDAAANDTLDKLGIAKNSREEKIRARDAKLKQDAENAQMAKLYREHVLGEKPVEGIVLDQLDRSGSEGSRVQAEEPVMGD